MTKEQAKMLTPGTLVECNTKNIYGITKPGIVCSYVGKTNLAIDDIRVKVESGTYKGSVFPVRSEHFDILTDFMNLFGHIHGRQRIKPFGLDVGVDTNNFTPCRASKEIRFFLNALDKGYYDEEVWVQ